MVARSTKLPGRRSSTEERESCPGASGDADLGSSPYTLTTASAQVAASSQVSASGQVAASCSCWVLSHQTLLWHHRLGHPSLLCLRDMHSRLLVSGLPRSLPSLPRSLAQPCLPCVEGQQRAAPHSSEFPPTIAPLQTLHMDVWGPAPVGGMDQERYFLLVVDDYTRYTTVFPLRRKADVSGVLIPWIRATYRQLREWFSRDFLVLHLHSDRGGEFSSDLLVEFYRDEGIVQSFTLPASPQQNGIAEHRNGLFMEVARTSMIHAASPHFLWPFAVRYSAHQLNLWPCVSEPETLPTLRWMGKVGDALVFRVWGALSLVRNAKASKLSSRTLRCVFLGFPTDAPACVSQVDPPPLVEPLEISSDSSGPSAGAEPVGAETEGEGSGGAALGGVATGGAGSGGAGSGGAATGGADFGGAASPSGGGAVGDPAGGPGAGLPPQPDLLETLSPQAIRAWIVQRGSSGGGGYCPAGAGAAIPGGTAGAGGTSGGAGATSPGGTGDAAGAGGTGAANVGGAAGAGGPGAASLVGARGAGAASAGRARVASAGGGGGTGGAGGAAGPGGTGAASAGGVAGSGGARAATAGGARAAGAGGTTGIGGAGPVGALRHLLGLPLAPTEFPVADTTPLLLFPQLLPHSPLPALAPYTTATESLTERREPKTHASTSERREPEKREYVPARVRRPRAPVVPSTHDMKLRPSSVPQRVVLPSPPASSLSDVADPPSDLPRASSPKVTHLLATVVTGPTFSSLAASALFTELVDFAAAHHLDYLAGLVSDPDPTYPPSVGGEAALGCDVLEDRQEELECLATTLSHLATMPLALEGDPDALYIPTPRSYKKAISGEHSSRWQTAMDAEMAFWKSTGNYIDEVPRPGANIVTHMWIFRAELQERHTCTYLGELHSYLGVHITWDRARCTITLTQSHMVHHVLQRFGFQFSSPHPTPLSTGHSLSAPPSNESVELSGPYPELVGCLMYLMTCILPDLAYPLSLLARYVAPGRHRKVHFDAAKRVLRYLCSSLGMGLVLGGRAVRMLLSSLYWGAL
ncbi:unnamed protein product [Closterium sp. NIES-53]